MRRNLIPLSAILAVVALTGCNPGEEKKERDGNKVVSRLQVISTAFDNAHSTYRELYDYTAGDVVVGAPTLTLDYMAKPEGCMFLSSEIGSDLAKKMYRNTTVGDRFVKGPAGTKELALYAPSYFSMMILPYASKNTLITEGTQGRLNWNQEFSTLAPGSGIAFQNFTTDEDGNVATAGTVYSLPTPTVKNEGEEGFEAVIKRTENLIVQYTPPAGNDYTRLIFNDRSGSNLGAFQCYIPGSSNGVAIPAGYFETLIPTTEGTLMIDFIKISRKTNLNGVDESVIQSVTRHIHGRIGAIETGETSYLGRLIFQ